MRPIRNMTEKVEAWNALGKFVNATRPVIDTVLTNLLARNVRIVTANGRIPDKVLNALPQTGAKFPQLMYQIRGSCLCAHYRHMVTDPNGHAIYVETVESLHLLGTKGVMGSEPMRTDWTVDEVHKTWVDATDLDNRARSLFRMISQFE